MPDEFHLASRLNLLARLTILHTNDLHGALTPEKAARICELKEANAPCLYFDSGDCIKAGNLAIPLRQESVWPLLAQAGCDASTLGNRESHPLESAFQAKLAGVRHPILVANLRRKGASETNRPEHDKKTDFGPTHPFTNTPSSHPPISSSPHPFPGSLVFEVGGVRVGVIGVMVPMVTERMKTAFVSAYLWESPIKAVRLELDSICGGTFEVHRNPPPPDEPGLRSLPRSLRDKERESIPELIVALTHIGITQDRRLAEACPKLDLILGGHSHTVLEQPERVGRTWICQGGSHGRYVGRYVWDSESGLSEAELLPL